MSTTREQTILYVDDDQDDLEMLREAVKIVDGTFQLIEATDGVEGLKQLKEMKAAHDLPCLIVLDLNMPRLDGRQTFLQIKADAALATIPVVIFSTSSSNTDRMFFQGDNVEYIIKPTSFAHLLQIATKLLKACK